MNILIVGNVLKDVYLNLDTVKNIFEMDKNGTKWLDVNFGASELKYFGRSSNFGGAAVSMEVLKKLGINSAISNSDFSFGENGPVSREPASVYRYILCADAQVSYLVPSEFKTTEFVAPTEFYDYLYVDRSAVLTNESIAKILSYLDESPSTKLVVYLKNDWSGDALTQRANLIFSEKADPKNVDNSKVVYIAEDKISFENVVVNISTPRVDVFTHLSVYSTLAATVLGCFALGKSVEDSLRLACVNAENSTLNSSLSISELEKINETFSPDENLELIAASLMVPGKGILAADESGGSIKKKFAQLNIDDTYENRHDYRDIFFTTPDLEKFVSGVILFDETARDQADDGETYTNYLISKCIVPGIKVDQGLEPFGEFEENVTKGLDGLEARLLEYHTMGLRFAKWRAAFNITDNTPTSECIDNNCRILAEYAKKCQYAGIVPIVEPEVVYDGYYDIQKSAVTTGKILDCLFDNLKRFDVNLRACILKVNMVLAGKKYEVQSTPEEVGKATAEVLKNHVPAELAGVVFLSGGQTVEQATDNLAEIVKNGPFPWPVTFSFARALQDPALFTWRGDNNNADAARAAFKERLIKNTEVL